MPFRLFKVIGLCQWMPLNSAPFVWILRKFRALLITSIKVIEDIQEVDANLVNIRKLRVAANKLGHQFL